MMVKDRSIVIVCLSFPKCFFIIPIASDKIGARCLTRSRLADIKEHRFLTLTDAWAKIPFKTTIT